ncbi:hypothetical protein GJ496_000241 [Pomphorhynchus laevis]|nr:hypothetical protein GJ496_000241 [Pomphorhynchus laevis]
MGNMAHKTSMGFKAFMEPQWYPNTDEPPTFDPLFGFPNGRKEREVPVLYSELRSKNVPLKSRDYCAHLYLEWNDCCIENFPFYFRCHGAKHNYGQCVYDDVILRMKEYERERRLLERERRIRAKMERNAHLEQLRESMSAE